MKKLIILAISLLSLGLQAQNATLSGTVKTEDGQNVDDVTITLFDSAGNNLAVTTGDSYSFSGLTQGDNYKVTFEKNLNPLNGVSTFDLVIIIRHILGVDAITSPYLLYAGDVNSSLSITVYDIVLLRKLILGIETALPTPSWQFLPSGIASYPSAFTLNEIETTLASDNETIDIIGFKMGDMNENSVPD
jgi:hypothetical protein